MNKLRVKLWLLGWKIVQFGNYLAQKSGYHDTIDSFECDFDMLAKIHPVEYKKWTTRCIYKNGKPMI